MKRRVVLIALVLLCTQVAFAQTTTNYGVNGVDTDYGDIYVAQTSYDPFPASPGTYIDIWYKIENRGDAALEDVKFILRPDAPFSLDSDTAIKSLGTIGPRSSALVKYEVRVSEDALQGDYDLTYTWTSTLWTDNAERASTISVRSTDALLVVSSVTADPETVAPGSSSKVTLTLDNVGDAFIRYVTVRFGLDTTDVPFTPVGSGTSVSVLNIAPGESRMVDMTISADPDAKSKTYRIPISINYVDSAGRNVSRSEQLGVRIGAEPQLLVYTDSNEVYDASAPGDITLRFVNNGVSGIKLLTVTLQDTNKLKVLSAPTQ